MDWSQIEMGPKLSACSERERAFVWHLLTDADGDATEAARLAGYSDPAKGYTDPVRGGVGDNPASSAIRVQAHVLRHRQRVIDAIEEVGRNQFKALLVESIIGARRMLSNKDHPDHAKMVQSMLSRLGFGERSGVDVNVSGEVAVNHTDAAVEQLRILRGLGVSREKLVESFGFSGLSRYEKMLDDMDRKSGRLIEHERQRAVEVHGFDIEGQKPDDASGSSPDGL